MRSQKSSRKQGRQASEFKVSCDETVSRLIIFLSRRPSLIPNPGPASESEPTIHTSVFARRWRFVLMSWSSVVWIVGLRLWLRSNHLSSATVT